MKKRGKIRVRRRTLKHSLKYFGAFIYLVYLGQKYIKGKKRKEDTSLGVYFEILQYISGLYVNWYTRRI
jgi:threonine/homoserine/homoserine lactone efflux protein